MTRARMANRMANLDVPFISHLYTSPEDVIHNLR
jgi:hypothetical protein